MSDHKQSTICGLFCSDCKFIEVKCDGCYNIKGTPFWTKFLDIDICPMYNCCVNIKKLDHCGLCNAFPCEVFIEMEVNDPNISSEEAEQSLENRINILNKRIED